MQYTVSVYTKENPLDCFMAVVKAFLPVVELLKDRLEALARPNRRVSHCTQQLPPVCTPQNVPV